MPGLAGEVGDLVHGRLDTGGVGCPPRLRRQVEEVRLISE